MSKEAGSYRQGHMVRKFTCMLRGTVMGGAGGSQMIGGRLGHNHKQVGVTEMHGPVLLVFSAIVKPSNAEVLAYPWPP